MFDHTNDLDNTYNDPTPRYAKTKNILMLLAAVFVGTCVMKDITDGSAPAVEKTTKKTADDTTSVLIIQPDSHQPLQGDRLERLRRIAAKDLQQMHEDSANINFSDIEIKHPEIVDTNELSDIEKEKFRDLVAAYRKNKKESHTDK